MRVHVLPILQLVLLPLCCTITYVWSVCLKHVSPGFPYISDTGTYPPESCVFGLLLALYAITTTLMLLIRWKEVKHLHQRDQLRIKYCTNNVSLVLGLIASFGILIVATFQVTNVIVVHDIGAACAFGVGSIYSLLQVYISYKARHLPACLPHFRLVLSLAVAISFVLVVVLSIVADHKFKDEKDNSTNKRKWKPEDEGFKEHVISTALEWFMAFLSAIFFATFYFEFSKCTVTMFEVTTTEVSDRAQANDEASDKTSLIPQAKRGYQSTGTTARGDRGHIQSHSWAMEQQV